MKSCIHIINNNLAHLLIIFAIILSISAGTISSSKSPGYDLSNAKKAVIFSVKNSQYIEFQLGTFTGATYTAPINVKSEK